MESVLKKCLYKSLYLCVCVDQKIHAICAIDECLPGSRLFQPKISPKGEIVNVCLLAHFCMDNVGCNVSTSGYLSRLSETRAHLMRHPLNMENALS
jgi:hypothetical protein